MRAAAPNGVLGDPTGASAAEGQALLAALTDDLVAVVDGWLTGMSGFRLDPGARRLDGGRALLAGSPLRLFRLTAGGADVVDAIERGEPVTTGGSAGRLVDRLLDAGAIHPRPAGSSWATGDDVTAVVPAFGSDVGPVVEAAPRHRRRDHRRGRRVLPADHRARTRPCRAPARERRARRSPQHRPR